MLVDRCYSYMFNRCTSLSSIDVNFTDWGLSTTINWVAQITTPGTFTCPAALPDQRGASKIPTNWTKVDKA